MRILSEQSPPELYVFATSKPGRSKKAIAELLDLVILSGCPPGHLVSNASETAFAVKLTPSCADRLARLVKSRGLEELAAVKLCSGPYTSMDQLLLVLGENRFSVNFREDSRVFGGLERKALRTAEISVEVFGDSAFICYKKLT